MKSIKLKIIIVVALITIVVISFLTITSVVAVKDTVNDIEKKTFPVFAQITSQYISSVIRRNAIAIEFLSHTNAVRSLTSTPEEKRDYIKEIIGSTTDPRVAFSYGTLDGTLYTTNDAVSNVGDRDYFKQVLATKKTVVSDSLISKSTGKIVIMIATPVLVNTSVVGLVIATVPLELIAEALADLKIGETGYVTLLDKTATIIAHPDEKMIDGRVTLVELAKDTKNSAGLDIVAREILEGKTGNRLYELNNVAKVGAYTHVPGTAITAMVSMSSEELFEGEVIATRNALLVAVVLIVISIIISVFFGSSISKPIIAITKEVLKLKDGVLKLELKTKSKDEIGTMTQALSEGTKNICDLIGTVNTEVKTMTHIGNELSSTSEQTASSVKEIAQNIEKIKTQVINQSAGVEETQATIEQITKNIEKLNADIIEQAASVENSSSATEEMIANVASVTRILEKNSASVNDLGSVAQKGRESLERANEHTKKIASDSEGLLEASSIIENIAAQTNLLAMNAAIEAAHAGDAGKGFAVVADEIRKLAENSSSQSKSITTVLTRLKTQIEDLGKASAFVQEQFNEIYDLTKTVQQQESTVTNMMQEQSVANDQVLRSLQKINQVTHGVQQGSITMLNGSKEIIVEMEKLADVTRVINDGMNEMSQATTEINASVQNVNSITQENKSSISKLVDSVGKFTF